MAPSSANWLSSYKIQHNNQELTPELSSVIKMVKVEEELNLPAMFSFRLVTAQPQGFSWQGIDLNTFKPGDEVKLALGMERSQNIIEGEITALDVEFGAECLLDVRGYDRLHRLRFGAKRRSFQNIKDSDLASTLASGSGLSVKADTTGQTFSYLFQNNQTDYEFLLERAQRIGYEILMDGKQLLFRKSHETDEPSLNLTYPNELQRFFVSLKALTVGSKVEVRGWDVKNKKGISGSATTGDESGLMGGRDSGYQISAKVSQSAVAYVDEAVMDDSEAQALAKAQFNRMLKDFLQGEGVCRGNAAIRAGKTIAIKGCGDRFSGNYYVIAATHTIDPKNGYLTKFKVKRTGI